MNTLPARFTHPHAELPTRAHPTDAGLDLAASETTQVAPRVVTLVPTGIAVAIPEGHVGLLAADHDRQGPLLGPLLSPGHRRVQRAEAAGFDGAMCSDHYAPWGVRQGESAFAGSWLGAALATTRCTNVTGKFDHDVVLVASS